jgi:hypothetical protein
MAKKCEQHKRIPVLVYCTVYQSAEGIKVIQLKKGEREKYI